MDAEQLQPLASGVGVVVGMAMVIALAAAVAALFVAAGYAAWLVAGLLLGDGVSWIEQAFVALGVWVLFASPTGRS